MVIVEGPDGSGKTTLAHKICKDFSLEYRRPPEALLSSETGPSDGLLEWWRGELRRPQAERRLGVYDRTFWISEPIYTAVGGRTPLCSAKQLADGIHDLWAESPLLIFCMTDEATMLENIFTGGRPRLADIGDDQKKLSAITFLYWQTFAWSVNALFECATHYDYIAHNYDTRIHVWLDDQGAHA